MVIESPITSRASEPLPLGVVALVEFVRSLPYGRPSRRTSACMLAERRGTCSTKHGFLFEVIRERYPELEPRLVHRVHRVSPEAASALFGEAAAAAVPPGGVVDVHRYLELDPAGRRICVDATFPGAPWDGASSMPLACGPGEDHPVTGDHDAGSMSWKHVTATRPCASRSSPRSAARPEHTREAAMGKTFGEITDHHRAWIARQSMFFVATAPLGAEGHVNVSPKGPVGSLQVLGPRHVAYLDVGGSGAETIAHVRENGRIVIMLCTFDGPPRILRLHGLARVVVRDEPGFDRLLARAAFEDASLPGARRSLIDVELTRVSDSCGYTVPLMSVDGVREQTWSGSPLLDSAL